MRARFARYLLTSDTKSVFSSRVGRGSKRSILYLFFSTESSSTKMAHKKRRKAPPHDGKVTTADVYSACVEIRNPDSKRPSNYGHIDISRYTDIRIESKVPSSEHKPRWTKETKPKGFDYLKQLFEDRADAEEKVKKSLWVAPMVDASDHAFRILCKRYGADGSYTPMIHSKIFMESAAFRKEYFSTHATEECRPLLAQFCANDPKTLLDAARIIQPFCDGVDINFGCPQRIAKRGNYGAFLMDDWPLVEKLIKELDEHLDVPVTAKIRVYDDLERSVAFAQMVEKAGAQIIAVHGRTREQKRLAEYKCNWDFIKAIKEAVSVPVLANGGVRNYEELQRCLEYTGADGYLSAEPLLGNPTLFSNPPFAPKPSEGQPPYPLENDHAFQIFLEYIDICRKHPTAPKIVFGHLHGIVGHWMHEFHDLRDDLNENRRKYADLDALTEWTEKLRARAKEVRETEGRNYPIRKMTQKQIERQKKREIAESIAAQENEEKILKDIAEKSKEREGDAQEKRVQVTAE